MDNGEKNIKTLNDYGRFPSFLFEKRANFLLNKYRERLRHFEHMREENHLLWEFKK